jgi:hypothetical protein
MTAHLPLLGVGKPVAAAGGPFGGHATLGSKIVAHWKLNESSGQRADAHSGAYHLSDNNTVTAGTGKIGDAALFVRANSEYLQGPNGGAFNPTAPFSFTLWAKFVSLPSANMGLFGKWTAAPQLSYRLFSSSTNSLTWTGSSDGSATTQKAHSATLTTGTWYFLYCYFDGSNLGLSIDNGTAQTTAFSGSPYAGSDYFRLGRMAGTYLDGYLDSVSFWNNTLSAGELSDLYNSGTGLDY